MHRIQPPVAQGQQLLEHDGDLDPVGGAQRVQLHGVFADGQNLLMGRTRHRAVDVGKLTAIGLVPGPDFGGGVAGGV